MKQEKTNAFLLINFIPFSLVLSLCEAHPLPFTTTPKKSESFYVNDDTHPCNKINYKLIHLKNNNYISGDFVM